MRMLVLQRFCLSQHSHGYDERELRCTCMNALYMQQQASMTGINIVGLLLLALPLGQHRFWALPDRGPTIRKSEYLKSGA